MKGTIIKALLYISNAFTIQYLVSFGRFERTDYIKLTLLFLVLFLSGYIVKYYEKKVSFYTIFFLIISLGFPFLASINNHWFINWLVEVAIGVPSFFVGFTIDRLPLLKKAMAAITIALYTAIVAFYINPRIVFTIYANRHSNKILPGKIVNFRLLNAEGRIITDSSLRGKVVLIDYWFIGCIPCYWKMRELAKLAEHYKDNKDVKIITVDAGFRDRFEEYKVEIKNFSGQMEHLFDSAGLTAERLGIKGYPTEYLIDKEGFVSTEFTGYTKDIAIVYFEKTKRKIDGLLRKK